MERVLIIGGPGNISTSTIQDLLRRGCTVGVFSHREEPARALSPQLSAFAGDRDRLEDLQHAVNAFRPDVVIDFVCFLPHQAEQILCLLYGQVSQYLFVSTVDVYGRPQSRVPLRESDPWTAPPSQYAADKLACERIFTARADTGQFPLTIARPSYSYGPRFLISFFSRDGGLPLLARLRAGRPVLVPGDGTTLLHFGCAHDVGRMIAAMAGAPVAIGRDYTCAHHTIHTQADYIRVLAGALGVEPHRVHIPSDLMLAVGGERVHNSMIREHMAHNIAYSIDRFRSDFPDFEWEWTVEEGARRIVEWNDQHGTLPDPDDEILEDRIIAAWRKCVAGFSF